MSWESPYFTSDEMKCRHTGSEIMDVLFMDKLTALRKAYGKPMTVSSAYRHATHPVEARKAAGTPSAHRLGRAVDILAAGQTAHEIIQIALEHGFTGIGIAQKGPWESRFIHIDDLQEKDGFPRPTVWSY